MRLEGKPYHHRCEQGHRTSHCLAFVREGAHLAVTARATDELESLRREAESFGVRCVAVTAILRRKAPSTCTAPHDALGPRQ